MMKFFFLLVAFGGIKGILGSTVHPDPSVEIGPDQHGVNLTPPQHHHGLSQKKGGGGKKESKAKKGTKMRSKRSKEKKLSKKESQPASISSFPNKYVYLGYNPGPGYAYKVPVKASVAESEGWEETFPGKWTNSNIELVTLVFQMHEEEMALSKIVVSGPKYFSTSETSELVVLFLANEEGKLEITVNDDKVPMKPDKAEDEGWEEGGCRPSMGGSHYFKRGDKGDWSQAPPLMPIYNKYGTKELYTVIVLFGNLGTAFGYLLPGADPPSSLIPNKGTGFDNYGIATNFLFACTFQFCNDEDCIKYVKENMDPGNSPMHIMLYDPSPENSLQWATCQKATDECEGCTCCGSPEHPVENTCTSPIWLPAP